MEQPWYGKPVINMKEVEDFINIPPQAAGMDFENRQPNEREIRYKAYSERVLKRRDREDNGKQR